MEARRAAFARYVRRPCERADRRVCQRSRDRGSPCCATA